MIGRTDILAVVTGEMGAGKSYYICEVLSEWFNRGYMDGKTIVTNIEFTEEAPWIDYVSKIPKSWGDDNSMEGPWNAGKDGKMLSDTIFIVDEAHHYIPRTKRVDQRRLWRECVREGRHAGNQFIFLSQNVEALDQELFKTGGQWYLVTKKGHVRNFITGLPYQVIYGIWEWISGKPYHVARIIRHIKTHKWVPDVKRDYLIKLDIIKYYKSFGKTESTEGTEYRGVTKQDIVYGIKQSLPWVLLRVVILVLFVWLFPLGGGGMIIRNQMKFITDSFTEGAIGKQETTPAGTVEAASSSDIKRKDTRIISNYGGYGDTTEEWIDPDLVSVGEYLKGRGYRYYGEEYLVYKFSGIDEVMKVLRESGRAKIVGSSIWLK